MSLRLRLSSLFLSGDDTVEKNLRFLAVVGLSMFIGFAVVLSVVQAVLNAAPRMAIDGAMPAQEDMTRLQRQLGERFRQLTSAALATSESEAALGQAATTERPLREDLSRLTEHLERAGTKVEAAPALERARTALDQFEAAQAKATEATLAGLRARNAIQTREATSEQQLRSLLAGVYSISGPVQLAHVALLRDLDGSPNAITARELTRGSARRRKNALENWTQSLLGLGIVSKRLALLTDLDSLNGLVANELQPAATRTQAAMTRVMELASEGDGPHLLAERKALEDFVTTVMGPGESLLELRRVQLYQQAALRQALTNMRTSTENVTAALAELDARVRAAAVATRTRASKIAQVAMGSTLLVTLLGLALVAASARKVRSSVRLMRSTNTALASAKNDLHVLNSGLEKLVAQRTAALQLVLDSTGDGLLPVSLDGGILPARSRAVDTWLGVPEEGAMMWNYLFPNDPVASAACRLGFQQLVDDILPFEVSAEQMTKRIERGGRVLSMTFRDIRTSDGALHRVLLILRDISAELAVEKLEQESREVQSVLTHLFRDRHGFVQAIGDCDALLQQMTTETDVFVVHRLLHTLKGNAAVLGFGSVAKACHVLEDQLVDDERRLLPSAEQLEALHGVWTLARARVDATIHLEPEDGLEIREHEFQALQALLGERKDHQAILEEVRSWRYESAAVVLERIAAHARRIGDQIGRPVDVFIEHHGLRLPSKRLAPVLSSIVHALRNAIDHGLEDPAERTQLGKPERGRVTLAATKMSSGELMLSLADDGRGIDFDKLAQVATRRGLPVRTHQDLVDALFVDGVSTRDMVTELSGRGVGLGALRDAIQATGGHIDVTSEAGKGTRLDLRFPPVALRPSYLPLTAMAS